MTYEVVSTPPIMGQKFKRAQDLLAPRVWIEGSDFNKPQAPCQSIANAEADTDNSPRNPHSSSHDQCTRLSHALMFVYTFHHLLAWHWRFGNYLLVAYSLAFSDGQVRALILIYTHLVRHSGRSLLDCEICCAESTGRD